MPKYGTIQMVVTIEQVHPEGGNFTECTDCGYGFVAGDTCFIKRDHENNARLICTGCMGDKE